MLDRYRTRQPAPAAPEALAPTGAEKAATVRAAPAAPAGFVSGEASPSETSEAGQRREALASLYVLPGHPGQPGQPATARVSTAPVGDQMPGQTGAPTYGTGRTTWGAPLPPPLPFVRCAECEHFRRNQFNPLAGVGRCRLGHPDGPRNMPQYPDAPRLCGSFRDCK